MDGAIEGDRAANRARGAFNPATSPQLQFYMPSIKATASSVAVEVSDAPVHAKEEIEGVIAAQARIPGGGLIVMPDAFTNTNTELIIALAARYRVPAIFNRGLIAYGTEFGELFRQAAEYMTASSKALSRVSCRSSSRPNTSWRLISRLRRRSA